MATIYSKINESYADAGIWRVMIVLRVYLSKIILTVAALPVAVFVSTPDAVDIAAGAAWPVPVAALLLFWLVAACL
jgi:hypothetical protein